MSRGVVISALGTVGAHGCGRGGLEQALLSGRPPASTEVAAAAGLHRRGAHRALLVPRGALAPWLPAAEARRMSPPSRLAVAAMRMALAESGLTAGQVGGPRTAVVVATTFGPASFSEALMRQILLEGPESASPYLFTESVANAAAAQIAIACGARGANFAVCQREAGALLALAHGAAEVAAGRADVVLAGVVDEIAPLTHGLLDRFGALARRRRPGAAPDVAATPVGAGLATRQAAAGAAGAASAVDATDAAGAADAADAAGATDAAAAAGAANAVAARAAMAAADAENGGEVARPFDRRRNGVVAAEGATVLVIEAEEAVRRRGRAPLAHIRGWGGAFDPSAPPAGWGCGHEMLGRAVRRLLARCAVPAAATAGPLPAGAAGGSAGSPAALAGSLAAMSAIDRIVSGASGARAGDRLEAQVLRAAWGELPLPPVLVPKGVTGEYGGGFLAAVVLAAAGAPFGPPAGFREPDPELGVVPHNGAPLPPPALLLVSSLAAGGAAAWVVLGRA